MSDAGWLVLVAVGIVGLVLGVWFLVRYARTRRRPFLVAGLVLTVGLGVVLIWLLLNGVPGPTIVYAPPPDAGP